jgi:hypothetical protein
VVAQQQAEQAAYEAANNTDNPQWFCAWVMKTTFSGNSPTYQVTLTPLVAQDCNVNYWGFSTNAFKQRILDTINNDIDLSTNCPNTKTYISGLDFPSTVEKFIYVNGSSLLSEVGLSTTTYTVVSPNTSKLFQLLSSISVIAQNDTSEATCQTAVANKLNSIPDSNTFCALYDSPSSTCSSGQTKVVFAQCAYGDIDINNDSTPDFRACATLNDQF